jgi:hypothetical protein
VVADVLRCIAFVVVMTADSLPVMIAGAGLAGLGTALFHPAALAGLPRLMGDGDEARAAGMGLFGAIDDLGLTAGPALAAAALAVISPSAMMGLNAVTFAISACLIATITSRGGSLVPGAAAAARRSLFADARAGVRELAARPEIRVLLGSSTGIVLCVGMALGGFGNGLALVHDRLLLASSTPDSLHGRLFALQKTCTSFAFALSFIASGALIAGAGVETAFLVSGLALALVLSTALPRLRAAWPTPPSGRPPALSDALA